MQKPPNLTDLQALGAHRARARRAPVTFLHEAIDVEIKERLEEVNKSFTKVAIVTGHPEYWSNAFPDANVVPDNDTLALGTDTYDLVIHAIALHWASDPVGQLVQCRHALRPDGLFVAAFFSGQTLHELRTSLAEAETRVTGGLSPRVAPMGEIRDLGGLLQRAGFALPVADVVPFDVSYESLWHLMKELRAMGESNALNARLKTATPRSVFFEAAQIYSKHFSDDAGRVRATFEFAVLTGWRPDPSQQQPLRPGSAKTRLSDALSSFEIPLESGDD